MGRVNLLGPALPGLKYNTPFFISCFGPRRFTLPISVGRLEIVDGKISATILNL
jgi:hypothetical protein